MAYRYSTLSESSFSPTSGQLTFEATSASNSEASVLNAVKPSLKEAPESSNSNTSHSSSVSPIKPHHHRQPINKPAPTPPPVLSRRQQGKLHSVLQRFSRRRGRHNESPPGLSQSSTDISGQENVPLKYVPSVSSLALCSTPPRPSVMNRQTSRSLDNILTSTSDVNHPSCPETLMV